MKGWPASARVNQLNVGWMASDNERQVQAAESGDPDWMDKAASQLPFGRLVDPEEAAARPRRRDHQSARSGSISS